MSRSIILIGASGAGKSTVGPLLADALGLPFVDVDARIEEREGTTIARIFADSGEPNFRELEAEEVLASLGEPAVIILGGGAPLTPKVADAIIGHTVVWLRIAAEVAAERVAAHADRPLLAGDRVGTLRRMVDDRTPVYARLATTSLDTDDLEPAAVRDRILSALLEES